METWKEIKFEFDTVDKLDVAHTHNIVAPAARRIYCSCA